jgi:hypothetical protein
LLREKSRKECAQNTPYLEEREIKDTHESAYF